MLNNCDCDSVETHISELVSELFNEPLVDELEDLNVLTEAELSEAEEMVCQIWASLYAA